MNNINYWMLNFRFDSLGKMSKNCRKLPPRRFRFVFSPSSSSSIETMNVNKPNIIKTKMKPNIIKPSIIKHINNKSISSSSSSSSTESVNDTNRLTNGELDLSMIPSGFLLNYPLTYNSKWLILPNQVMKFQLEYFHHGYPRVSMKVIWDDNELYSSLEKGGRDIICASLRELVLKLDSTH